MHIRRDKANVGTAAVCDISEMTIASLLLMDAFLLYKNIHRMKRSTVYILYIRVDS